MVPSAISRIGRPSFEMELERALVGFVTGVGVVSNVMTVYDGLKDKTEVVALLGVGGQGGLLSARFTARSGCRVKGSAADSQH
jgi:hypothetical protein